MTKPIKQRMEWNGMDCFQMLSADSGHGLSFLSNDGTAASRANKQKHASKNEIISEQSIINMDIP